MWPDKYFLVNNEDKQVLYHSDYSSRKAGVVDIDICWVIEYLAYCKNKGRMNPIKKDLKNMVSSY